MLAFSEKKTITSGVRFNKTKIVLGKARMHYEK